MCRQHVLLSFFHKNSEFAKSYHGGLINRTGTVYHKLLVIFFFFRIRHIFKYQFMRFLQSQRTKEKIARTRHKRLLK